MNHDFLSFWKGKAWKTLYFW